MIALAQFVVEHKGAVEYDLMTKAGYTLQDVGGGLSWSALFSFVTHIEADSALMRELRPELSVWSTQAKTNAILADIYDVLSMINSNLCAKGSGKRAKRPQPYPRPVENKTQKRIGKGMPISELHKKIFGK